MGMGSELIEQVALKSFAEPAGAARPGDSSGTLPYDPSVGGQDAQRKSAR
jgi:hypothetical protein